MGRSPIVAASDAAHDVISLATPTSSKAKHPTFPLQ